MSVLDAIARRRSWPRVSDASPSHAEVAGLVAVAANSADHGALRPWRIIELRGGAQERLGAALVAASGLEGDAAARLAAKPLRAPLLLAIVAAHKESAKVPDWEQDAAAAGVAHGLSLALDAAGWGVMWRTGGQTRSSQVAAMHALSPNEHLLGWLYVGGKAEGGKPNKREPFDADAALTVLD